LKKILITGANGFLGSALALKLQHENAFDVLQTTRLGVDKGSVEVDFSSNFNIEKELDGVEVIIHCAARVHLMQESSNDPLVEYRRINTNSTLRLVEQAVNAGVKRFIFISTIKVNGESTELDKPFKQDDTFVPTDPYGLSKYEAEVGLRKIAQETGLEVVIIRPPLVYGPGVKANFASMMKWLNKGLPLPLGGINNNKRSLVSVDNLVNLIKVCIDHPKAANETFLVSDDEDLSTTQLLSKITTALGAPNRLLPIPAICFVFVAKLIRKPSISQRLCGSLQVDISKTKELLNWTPPYRNAECLQKTATAFLENLNRDKKKQ
tara:strand:+ start:41839 stop:42804 length:966 start_codon:yes stop_codon:yes gene_type:complete